MLGSSEQPLAAAYDVAMLDLDGVVYVGDEPVPGAAEAIVAARSAGQRIAFITNNASRSPTKVAAKINRAGVEADADEVVTSAQAAARVLRSTYGEGALVATLGAAGLHEALAAAGLVPEEVDHADVVALVTGYGPDVVWRDVMRAAVRVREGLPWVASNTDGTIPTAFGIAPGHGVMVQMLRSFTGREPVVAGKPERPLFDETIARTGARRPLMVGDRLDTDIEGASAARIDSLLVMTGVTGLAELVAAGPHLRPTYLSADLRGLVEPHQPPVADGDRWSAGGWSAQVVEGCVEVEGEGARDDWWRVVAAAAWQSLDDSTRPVDVSGLQPPPATDPPGTLAT